MTNYTKDGCFPRWLPDRIILSNNEIRTDASTYTPEEIADAGWTVAPDVPDFNALTHKPVWNSNTSQFDLEEISQDEIDRHIARSWAGIRHERNELLAATDYIVIKATETGTSIPTEWAEYRQALRDLPDNNSDYTNITWPTKPS